MGGRAPAQSSRHLKARHLKGRLAGEGDAWCKGLVEAGSWAVANTSRGFEACFCCDIGRERIDGLAQERRQKGRMIVARRRAEVFHTAS
jgi:hypothetical protein